MYKTRITHEGQPCRRCGEPVVKKSHEKPTHSHSKYFFKYWFKCPNKKCNTIYLVPEAKVHLGEK